jgi:transcriptional regulator with XRE-family HTH domain
MPTVGSRSRPKAQREAEVRLGPAIRSLRRERGLTLLQLAAATGLSQPFLSQLELGRSRPSMRSLYRIATALGTTQQTLLAVAAAAPSGDPVRVADAAMVDMESGGGRLLLHDPGVDVTELVGVPAGFGEFFRHGRHELVYVAQGTIEVELREDGVSRFATLGTRDSMTYAGSVEHRFRQLGDVLSVVLVVHTGA